MEIRRAQPDDLAGIVNIYHYVLNSVATFDESPVTAEDRGGVVRDVPNDRAASAARC